jgi:membrane-bound ClpP family serine protease
MQQVIQQNQKKFGTVSFIDNKVRINYNDGTDSVLFEDISSISYKSINQPNFLISLAFTFLGIIIMFANIGNLSMLYLSIFIIVIGIILMFVLPIKFDNVIVETRGGKLLVYSVESGRGKEQMETIETEKRNQR